MSSTAFAQAPPKFMVLESQPETLVVVWSNPATAGFSVTDLDPGDRISTGDTLFRIEDEIENMEIQRLEMELVFADAAFLTGDSSFVDARDSLLTLLDRLDGTAPLLSDFDGILISAADSGPVETGDTIALLQIPSDSLFTLVPPENIEMHFWPAYAGTSRFVELCPRGAVYFGVIDSVSYVFPGTWIIPRQALRDSGLDHFVISIDGDTIDVERLATAGSDIIVVSRSRLEEIEFVLWAASSEQQEGQR